MQGIAGVTARIATIQTQMLSVATMGAARTAAAPAAGAPTGTAKTSFADSLASAVAATKAAAPAKASGKLNADGVPVELARYGNGKIPRSELSTVGSTGHRLWAPAAHSLESMIAAAKQDGVKIGVTDSYRPYAEQVDLVRRKGLYSQGGLAAKPGTSEHGWGMAVDLDLNGKAQAWMRTHGKQYGFVENTPREPWHWAYRP